MVFGTTTLPDGTMEEAWGRESPGAGEARRKVHSQPPHCPKLRIKGLFNLFIHSTNLPFISFLLLQVLVCFLPIFSLFFFYCPVSQHHKLSIFSQVSTPAHAVRVAAGWRSTYALSVVMVVYYKRNENIFWKRSRNRCEKARVSSLKPAHLNSMSAVRHPRVPSGGVTLKRRCTYRP